MDEWRLGKMARVSLKAIVVDLWSCLYSKHGDFH